MEEEGWSKNNGIVVASAKAAKTIDRALLCFSPLSSPLISFSFPSAFAPLTRHRCVAQKKRRKRERERASRCQQSGNPRKTHGCFQYKQHPEVVISRRKMNRDLHNNVCLRLMKRWKRNQLYLAKWCFGPIHKFKRVAFPPKSSRLGNWKQLAPSLPSLRTMLFFLYPLFGLPSPSAPLLSSRH